MNTAGSWWIIALAVKKELENKRPEMEVSESITFEEESATLTSG